MTTLLAHIAHQALATYLLTSNDRDIVLCESLGPVTRRDFADLPRVIGGKKCVALSSKVSTLLPRLCEDDPNHPLYQRRQRIGRTLHSLPYRLGRPLPKGRPKVLLLGSGWASIHFLKQIDPTKYDVTVISPRPFFVFTPLLPTALGGVLSTRAVIEPIRNFLMWAGRKSMDYLEGRALDIDFAKSEVVCTSRTGDEFRVPFDKLVCAVGSETNTFGIPGVSEHASFLKEVEDAREIRLKVMNAFEQAALPSTSDAERRRLLHFVVVGGGPAGVEAAGELHDMLSRDVSRYYPELTKLTKVTVIEMLPSLIPMFGEAMSAFTRETFRQLGIDCLMEHRVTKVSAQSVTVSSKATGERELPCSVVVWASGVGQVDLIKTLMSKLSQQKAARALMVTPDLKVQGSDSIYALGDCAYLTPQPLSAIAEQLYETAAASPYGAGISWLKANRDDLLRRGFAQLHPTQCAFDSYKDGLTREAFNDMLQKIDAAYRPPVATAQMARQAGAYLGAVFNSQSVRPRSRFPLWASMQALRRASQTTPDVHKPKLNPTPLPYTPTNYGHMSYIGGGKAVVELTRQRLKPKPKSIRIMGGRHVSLFWHGYYWLSQTSASNRTLALFDYSRKLLKGREITEAGLISTADRVNTPKKPSPPTQK